jgi:competence ComEA-like helix-hairpin-helix protein
MFDNRYKTDLKMNRLQSTSFFFAACLVFIFCLYWSFGVSQKISAQPVNIEYRINPNEASAASLMRLPAIGLSKANAIIEFRKQFEQNNPGNLAFKDCNDLDKVKGIGPATVSNMCEYFKFDRK